MMRKREGFEVRRCRAAAHFERSRAAWLAIGFLLCAMPSFAAQDWRGKRVYFGDAHWHSCLSQDAPDTTLTSQYESMLQDYHLDFSLQSDHAEGAEAGINDCDTYLPKIQIGTVKGLPVYKRYSGNEIATAMKEAADDWNGRECVPPECVTPNQGTIRFVTFPGYEWAPDSRCWQGDPLGSDSNTGNNTPGHINYFFSDTTGSGRVSTRSKSTWTTRSTPPPTTTRTTTATTTTGRRASSTRSRSTTLRAPRAATSPPEITCPAGLLVECSAAGGVPASDAAVAAFLAGATATDAIDPTPVITHDAPSFFPNAATVVTFTATDDAGNAASCSAAVTVGDATTPQLTTFSLSPATLAPPNHKLVQIAVPTLVATDVCDPAPRIRCGVESDQPANGLGDGDQPIDIVFNGEQIPTQGTGERQIATTAGRGTFSLELRAERDGRSDGRVYTATCVGVDAAGGRSTARDARVRVPR